ncbi:hypothetical protein BpHYR1_032276 [Brachionus plicatilis]|uniref:Uncharacterized protein n=1 Tax=Brachionus plicatilis TaxID=10195 RepID=A0A3M7Q7L2_BRAPC|nr:hypothetical protein BpHYR1_032276 [Brachionus plicatilis]
MKRSIKCLKFLIINCLFYYMALEFTRNYVQNSSRRICNLAFVFFIKVNEYIIRDNLKTDLFCANNMTSSGIIFLAGLFIGKCDICKSLQEMAYKIQMAKKKRFDAPSTFNFLVATLISLRLMGSLIMNGLWLSKKLNVKMRLKDKAKNSPKNFFFQFLCLVLDCLPKACCIRNSCPFYR